MTILKKNTLATPTENNFRGLVICQILGLIALAVVLYSIASHNYRVLIYTAAVMSMFLIIPKPSLIPYVFIVSFFTNMSVIPISRMTDVKIMDITFLCLKYSNLLLPL